jgi:hypothetical protein
LPVSLKNQNGVLWKKSFEFEDLDPISNLVPRQKAGNASKISRTASAHGGDFIKDRTQTRDIVRP